MGARSCLIEVTLEYTGLRPRRRRLRRLSPEGLPPRRSGAGSRRTPTGIVGRSPLRAGAASAPHDGKYRWFLIRYNPYPGRTERRVIRCTLPGPTSRSARKRKSGSERRTSLFATRFDRSSHVRGDRRSSDPCGRYCPQIAKVAPTDSTVLIAGENQAPGKELVARAIHSQVKNGRRELSSA